MIVFKKAGILSQYLSEQKKNGSTIGFVPTMGALHEGHLSLVHSSKKQNDITVCSVFVNPTQFNNAEDLRHYPVTIEKDVEKLVNESCDVLFLPPKEEIYPPDFIARHYNLGALEDVLEGAYRPGHFQGVCQVVDRLLQIVEPHNLYLGAKDYQQCKVIAKLISILVKEKEIALHIEPTFREKDGLAMSSRNLRLSPTERTLAPAIFKALLFIQQNQDKKPIEDLQKEATTMLLAKGFKVDYLQVADAATLHPASKETPRKIALAAAYLGTIRLIDNLSL